MGTETFTGKEAAILATPSGISVKVTNKDGFTSTEYDKPTVENLMEAARITAAWLDLSYDDRPSEIRRIHNADQFRAFLKETLRNFQEADDA